MVGIFIASVYRLRLVFVLVCVAIGLLNFPNVHVTTPAVKVNAVWKFEKGSL